MNERKADVLIKSREKNLKKKNWGKKCYITFTTCRKITGILGNKQYLHMAYIFKKSHYYTGEEKNTYTRQHLVYTVL
jgi:hypothetical protein